MEDYTIPLRTANYGQFPPTCRDKIISLSPTVRKIDDSDITTGGCTEVLFVPGITPQATAGPLTSMPEPQRPQHVRANGTLGCEPVNILHAATFKEQQVSVSFDWRRNISLNDYKY